MHFKPVGVDKPFAALFAVEVLFSGVNEHNVFPKRGRQNFQLLRGYVH